MKDVDQETTPRKLKVLFLCPHNSARSQMAEAILRTYAGNVFEVISAGLDPRPIDPAVVEVMHEIGIDISTQTSKSVRPFLGRLPVRYAIIVCDKDEADCPRAWVGALETLQWSLAKPAGADGSRLSALREVREKIAEKIMAWLNSLGITPIG